MSKLKLIAATSAALVLGGGAALSANVYVSATQAGLSFSPAPITSILPATTAVYLDYNHSGGQQAALNHLVALYKAHPGTSTALAALQGMVGKGASPLTKSCLNDLGKPNSLLSAIGADAGLAVLLNAKGSTGDAAIVAQIKITTILANGGGVQFKDLGKTTPVASYKGTSIYRFSFSGKCGAGSGTTSGYISVFAGDLVYAGKLDTIHKMIDVSKGAASLSGNGDYAKTVAQLPSSRLVTVYVAKNVTSLLQQALNKQLATPGLSSSARQTLQGLPNVNRPYAFDVALLGNGMTIDTSAIPGAMSETTPNAGATIAGSNSILYASSYNLARTLRTVLKLVPAKQIASFQGATGVNLDRDVFSWMSGEYFLNLNSATTPLVSAFNSSLAAGVSGGSTPKKLPAPPPGALELGWHVANAASTQASLDRIGKAVGKALTHSSAPFFSAAKGPGGTTLHLIASLPGIGYAFRGNWLIFSSNIQGDAAPSGALTSAADYHAAIAHLGGAKPTAVFFMSTRRLLSLIDTYVAYIHTVSPKTVSPGQWQQVRALIAPFTSILSYAEKASATDATGHVLVTIQ